MFEDEIDVNAIYDLVDIIHKSGRKQATDALRGINYYLGPFRVNSLHASLVGWLKEIDEPSVIIDNN